MTETFLGGNITAEFDGFFLQLAFANEYGVDTITLSIPQWEELKRYMELEIARKHREHPPA